MKIIGIGETVCDIIFKNDVPWRAVPGGSTFNSMISLGRTLGKEGIPCVMISAVGDDHVGQYVGKFMTDSHVSSAYLTQHKDCQSTISLAFLDENNDAQYEFYKDHANAQLNSEKFESIRFEENDIVLFGSFFAINPVLRNYTKRLFSAAHAAGATIYYDINFRKSHIKDIPTTIDNIIENFKFATIVRGSSEDFGYLFGTTNPQEIYENHIKQHCDLFICTDGGNPISLFTPNFVQKYQVEPVNTISTIGAGDNFNAGFIYGLIAENLSKRTISNITIEQWRKLVASGQKFSSKVCQSIYNYIDSI